MVHNNFEVDTSIDTTLHDWYLETLLFQTLFEQARGHLKAADRGPKQER